jgi:hypothetical protein
MSPYKSLKQAAYFHANVGKKKGITPKVVAEFDEASVGKVLPKKVKKTPSLSTDDKNFVKRVNQRMGR